MANSENTPLALVTGGASRLGHHLALALGRNGYDVVISYHRSGEDAVQTVDELRAMGRVASAFRADLSRYENLDSLIESIETSMGHVDLLVNNAAVFPGPGEISLDSFDEIMAVNLRAPFFLGLECGKRMQERGSGCIVNIGSAGGLTPYLQHIPYSVSKAGLHMLTQALALKMAPLVRVNAVAPGTIRMDAPGDGVLPAEDGIPLGRHADPEEISEAVLYLARASHVTGEILAVDGGASLSRRRNARMDPRA